MNLFGLSGMIIAVNCALLVLIALRRAKSVIQFKWVQFNSVTMLWGIGCVLISNAGTVEEASLAWKVAFSGALFASVLMYDIMCKFTKHHGKGFLIYAYVQGVIFLILAWYKNVVFDNWNYYFDSLYYSSATPVYYVLIANWLLVNIVGHYKLHKFALQAKGVRQIQARYLYISSLIGQAGGVCALLPSLGLAIYPYSNFLIPLYSLAVGYAMFKYNLMEINIVITRIGIFAAVYSIVLGIPFAIAFGLQDFLVSAFSSTWWIVPMVASTFLATIGPYLYLYIQGKAEDKLLQEQRQYQHTLSQASLGMGRIKDLKKLLLLIVRIVTRAVRIEYCQIFLFHEDSNQYILKASNGKVFEKDQVNSIAHDSVIVNRFKKDNSPILYDEIKQQSLDLGDEGLANLENALHKLDASLVVPSFIDQKLISVVVLGEKKTGKLYTEDDMAVFSILANQSALAIENAQYYEQRKKKNEQLFKAEKMATIGTMADGLSHQINNRFHAMGFIASDALDSINLQKPKRLSSDMQELFGEIEHSLNRIRTNVKQGGEVVEGLLKYTRKGDSGFTAVDLNELLDASLEMVQYKVNLKDINLERNFNSNLPKMKGNFTQLQEVFFNLIDNANDAMIQRRKELNEQDFKAALIIAARNLGDKLEIYIQDNGMGVKTENIQKMFTPFFTTKLSSKKGTGLGLYVIRQIIEEIHGGKVSVVSEHGKGTEIKIVLPVAAQEPASMLN